ncbi:MAG: hypothetical protein FWG40_06255 [Peptococcaceae bacterium]|nr:hypothetical protein [Peptococcaceae bacterium]
MLWDAETGECSKALDCGKAVNRLAFGEIGGRTLLVTSHGNSLRLWDPRTHEQIKELTGEYDCVGRIAIGQVNGRTILAAVGNWDNQTVQLWDPQTGPIGSPIYLMHKGISVNFSPNGCLAVTTRLGVAVLTPEFLQFVVGTQ